MFLLFLALLLTTTTPRIYKMEPNLRFANAADDPCNEDYIGEPVLTYAFLDEFMDEATMVLPGGWLKMTCNSSKVHFLQFDSATKPYNISGQQVHADRTTVTVPVNSSSVNKDSFKCQCDNLYLKESLQASLKYIVCSREQYRDSSSECQLEEVCLVKESAGPGSCQGLIHGDCDMGVGVKRTLGMEYTTVCLGNSTTNYESECKAGANAGARDGWPMVETTKKGDCNNQELRNFWKGNFSLRHNIAVKDSLTFRPRNQNTTLVCQNGIMTCHRKCFGDREPKNVTGSCSTGWTVTTKMTENCDKTKFYCIYQQNLPTTPKFRWQFYLYSANVDVTFNGTKAQCKWPGWTGLGMTNPEIESKTCQQEFNFPYPVNPEGRKLELGDNTSITDIPTTTTETTTTRTTTKSTKQSTTTTTTRIPDISNIASITDIPTTTTETTTTPSTTKSTKQSTTTTTTHIPDISNIASITDIPTTTTETTTTPSTTKSTKQSTTTTTTRIPDISNIASITLNTTTNISQQMPPRNKSWSSKQDVFILMVGQFLLFLLPSFMLYKEGSPYIKE